jgi:dihydroflavonol-4-reductase
MSKRVLVTGITGYIGQHCAVELLSQGYEVIGSIRSKSKADSTRDAIGKFAPIGKLSFAEADLLSDKGWDDAIRGCDYVLHVASPFMMKEPKDENIMIVPAVDGTLRVIKAAQRSGVKRFVLTSSTFAIIAGRASGHYSPSDWSDTEANIGAYAKSKTLAEKAAWKANEGATMEMVVINPGAVFGPSVGEQAEAQNMAMITKMIQGKIPMIPDVGMGMIDVRDVARLHVKAMIATGAAGKRFIAASAEPMEMATVAAILKNAGYSKVPSRRAPSLLLRFIGLFDREAKGMIPFLGQRASFDNKSTFEILDWKPTPMEDSFREMAASISN